MKAHYFLECEIKGVIARIAVDDVPVCIHERDADCVTKLHINPWLADEPTEIRFEVAGTIVAGALAGVLNVALVARSETEGEEDLRELVRVSLPKDAVDVVKRGEGWQLEHSLRLSNLSRPPSVFWPDARPIVLRDRDRADIHELVLDVQRALDWMDPARLEELFGFEQAETARAYHVSVDDVKTSLAMMLSPLVGDEEVDPRSEEGLAELAESIELHLVGRDRLVWVTRDGYANVLHVPAVNPEVTMPLYLAPRDGRWTIVR